LEALNEWAVEGGLKGRRQTKAQKKGIAKQQQTKEDEESGGVIMH